MVGFVPDARAEARAAINLFLSSWASAASLHSTAACRAHVPCKRKRLHARNDPADETNLGFIGHPKFRYACQPFLKHDSNFGFRQMCARAGVDSAAKDGMAYRSSIEVDFHRICIFSNIKSVKKCRHDHHFATFELRSFELEVTSDFPRDRDHRKTPH